MTFPLNFPNIPIAVSQVYLAVNQKTFSADISGIDTVTARDGKTDRWQGTFTTPQLSLEQHLEFTAWILSLRGRAGTFYAFDPDRKEPSTKSGSFPGNGFVNGANQTGNTLATDGWPAAAMVLKAGDLFQVETQLYEVITDVLTDSTGNAMISFEPEIRISPGDNSIVKTSSPVMISRLKKPDTNWLTNHFRAGSLAISFEEVI